MIAGDVHDQSLLDDELGGVCRSDHVQLAVTIVDLLFRHKVDIGRRPGNALSVELVHRYHDHVIDVDLAYFEEYLDLVRCYDLVGLVPTDDLPLVADGVVLLNPLEDYPRVYFHPCGRHSLPCLDRNQHPLRARVYYRYLLPVSRVHHRLLCPLLPLYSNPSQELAPRLEYSNH